MWTQYLRLPSFRVEYVGWAALAAACLASGITDDPEGIRWGIVYLIAVFGAFQRFHRGYFIAALWLAWMALTALWAPDWKQSLIDARDALCVILAGFMLARCRLDILFPIIGAAFLVMWFTMDRWAGFGNPNFAAEFLALLIPWLGWLNLVAIPVFLTMSPNLVWVTVLAWVIALSWHSRPRTTIVVFGACGTGGAIMALLSEDIAASIGVRLELWYNTLCMWLDRPVFGWGNFNYVYPLYQERHLEAFPTWDTMLHPIVKYAGAAHNEILQILAQYGLVGLLIAALCMTLVLKGQGKAWWTVWTGLWLSLVGFPLHNAATGLILVCCAASLLRESSCLRDFCRSARKYRLPLYGRLSIMTPSGR